jgi:hypothetical protein
MAEKDDLIEKDINALRRDRDLLLEKIRLRRIDELRQHACRRFCSSGVNVDKITTSAMSLLSLRGAFVNHDST